MTDSSEGRDSGPPRRKPLSRAKQAGRMPMRVDAFAVLAKFLDCYAGEMTAVVCAREPDQRKWNKQFKEHRRRVLDVDASQLFAVLGGTEVLRQSHLVYVLVKHEVDPSIEDEEEKHKDLIRTTQRIRQRVTRFADALVFFGLLDRRREGDKPGRTEIYLSVTELGRKTHESIRWIDLGKSN